MIPPGPPQIKTAAHGDTGLSTVPGVLPEEFFMALPALPAAPTLPPFQRIPLECSQVFQEQQSRFRDIFKISTDRFSTLFQIIQRHPVPRAFPSISEEWGYKGYVVLRLSTPLIPPKISSHTTACPRATFHASAPHERGAGCRPRDIEVAFSHRGSVVGRSTFVVLAHFPCPPEAYSQAALPTKQRQLLFLTAALGHDGGTGEEPFGQTGEEPRRFQA